MKQFLISFFDFFLPRTCYSCDKVLNSQEMYVCPKCFENLKITPSEFLTSEYERHFKDPNYVKEFLSMYLFEKDKTLQFLMHQLKYKKKFRTGLFLGRIISEHFSEEIKNWESDYIIPVPLHKLRKADRGYNQSHFIAKGISRNSNIPVKNNLLKRVRQTSTQTRLKKEERKENISNAFLLKNKSILLGKNIILVDDVITTGSTINECAKVLKENGAGNIYALSAGIAALKISQ